jgi:uncharacterized protein YndB with AHSA1/START domain
MHAAVDNLPELTGDEKAIESSRWFKAPRWMVWEAFADPKQVVQWWGTAWVYGNNCRDGAARRREVANGDARAGWDRLSG